MLPALERPPAGRWGRFGGSSLSCVLPLSILLWVAGCGPDRPATPPADTAATGKPVATDAELAQARAAADKALDDGRVDDALTLATFVAERDRTGAGHELLGRTWLVRATQADQAGETAAASAARSEAAHAYRRAAAADPTNHALHDAAGLVVDATGDLAAAISHYSTAIQLAPTVTSYRLHRANAYLRDGQLAPAHADARALLDVAPNEPWSHALLAEVHLSSPNPKLALESALKARELAPNEIAFRLLCSKALRANGRASDAVELLVGLPDSDRGSIAVAGELALGWRDLGRPERAAEAWRLAYRRAPQHEQFACAIAAGTACVAAKDFVGAEQWLEMAKLLRAADPRVERLRTAIVDAKSASQP